MLKLVPHVLAGVHSGSYRTEDVKFSPSGRRLALVATENCVLVYAVDTQTRPIRVEQQFELRSPGLCIPHGVDFLEEDLIVIANRNADLAFFRIPPVTEPGTHCITHSIIEPLHRAYSPWFATNGIKRKLRGRELFCGPGSVRLFDRMLFICCNYTNTLSTHYCQHNGDSIQVQDDAIVAQDGLEIIDGVGMSRDGRRIALSDHDHHRVVVYERIDSTQGSAQPRPRFVQTATLHDENLRYPHGLCFDPAGKTLFAVDAGSPYLYMFATHDDWHSNMSASSFKLTGVEEEIFSKTQAKIPEVYRMLEGGAKGIDMDPTGQIIVITCSNQPLHFFELVPVQQGQMRIPARVVNPATTAIPATPALHPPLQAHQPLPQPVAANTRLAPGSGKIALSCVVDDTPGIWRSIIPWLATATTLANLDPAHIHVHHVCPLPAWIAELCARLGVHTHAIAPFNAENPYTNKIRQCATDFGAVDSVMLTDVDLAFACLPPCRDFQHGIQGDHNAVIAGKLVDKPNPPLEILLEVFAAAGIAAPASCHNSFFKRGVPIGFDTLPGNFNGGMYLIAHRQLAAFGERWGHWAHWLAERQGLLQQWTKHVDQVAFCLALHERQTPIQLLDNRWNFPTHLNVAPLCDEPYVFHHHTRLDDDLNLIPAPDPDTEPAMQRINQAIQAFRQQHGLVATVAG